MTMQKVIMSGDRLGLRGNAFMQVFGRLAPNSSIDRAQASASAVAAGSPSSPTTTRVVGRSSCRCTA